MIDGYRSLFHPFRSVGSLSNTCQVRERDRSGSQGEAWEGAGPRWLSLASVVQEAARFEVPRQGVRFPLVGAWIAWFPVCKTRAPPIPTRLPQLSRSLSLPGCRVWVRFGPVGTGGGSRSGPVRVLLRRRRTDGRLATSNLRMDGVRRSDRRGGGPRRPLVLSRSTHGPSPIRFRLAAIVSRGWSAGRQFLIGGMGP